MLAAEEGRGGAELVSGKLNVSLLEKNKALYTV
jgi:hypothetical protein